MKVLILLLFAVLVGLGTKAIKHSAAQPESKAEFHFETENHDFGKVLQGKTVSVDFKFTNTGNAPLIISKVESTAASAVPQYSTSPVNKGESGTISVKFTAGTQPQGFIKAITVRSNAKTPVKVLYIKGEIVTSEAASK